MWPLSEQCLLWIRAPSLAEAGQEPEVVTMGSATLSAPGPGCCSVPDQACGSPVSSPELSGRSEGMRSGQVQRAPLIPALCFGRSGVR